MGRTYNIIDADGHVLEPVDLWETYILWATDYPHPDGFFPGAPKLIADRPELSAETKRQILAGGAKRFYALT